MRAITHFGPASRQKVDNRWGKLMDCHQTSAEKQTDKDVGRIILLGNPNVGKSAVFGALTGKYATVSNYPGTTVEVTSSRASFKGQTKLLLDTPGVNSLNPMSEDERVARDILLTENYEGVIQVADSKNLERSLSVTLQLIEMGVPIILDLNMEDEAKSRGIIVDTKRLSETLGVEVVSTVATQGKGIDTLRKTDFKSSNGSSLLDYGDKIEEAVEKLSSLLPQANISRRSMALMLLSEDQSLLEWLSDRTPAEDIEKIGVILKDVQAQFVEPMGYVLTRRRIKAAQDIMAPNIRRIEIKQKSLSRFLGNIAIHPLYGIPFALVVLYLTYQFVGVLGAGTFVDFLESVVFGEYLNVWATKLVTSVIGVKAVQEFFVGEYGLVTMALAYGFAIILPIVGTFFIVFSILEDSGYLPRLAIMVNRIFKVMGLNGKAVLPMVLGLGCDTMATMTTRILESKKERVIMTLLLALGVPCSAQLGVILGMITSLSFAATVLWAGSVVGVILLVGVLASKVLPGRGSDFVLEIPPMRVPQLSNIVVKTVARIEWYLKEVIPLFILGTAILYALDKLNLLARIERIASPLVETFLGLPPKATQAFLIGFLRRDYGAAGLFELAKEGMLSPNQIVVSLVTITLFVPCIANFFVIIKERGLGTAIAMVAFIFPFAFLIGGLINTLLHYFGVQL